MLYCNPKGKGPNYENGVLRIFAFMAIHQITHYIYISDKQFSCFVSCRLQFVYLHLGNRLNELLEIE